MNDLQWVAVGTALMALLCYVITGPDRRAFRHWWRRRTAGRSVPWAKIVLTFLPLVLALIAVGLFILGHRSRIHLRGGA